MIIFPLKKYTRFFLSLSVFMLFSHNASAATESVSLIRQDCTGYSQCYNSLSAWESAQQKDLVAQDQIAVARIEGSWTNPDTIPVSIDGWTTDAAHYIKIYAAPEARHAGKWDVGKYRLEPVDAGALRIQEDYARVDGLQIGIVNPTAQRSEFSSTFNQTGEVILSNSIIRGSGANSIGISVSNPATGSLVAYNNIVYNAQNQYFGGLRYGGSGTVRAYNNTFVNTYYGIRRSGGTIIAKNNLVVNAVSSAYVSDGSAGWGAGSDHNMSSDGTSTGGAHDKINQTIAFVNSGSNDYHLASSATAIINAGTDLSADIGFAFVTDIDGETRSGAWDIGADEYGATSGGSGSAPPPVVADTTAPVRSNASPSGVLASGTTQATLAVTTNESATCKYSTTANEDYLIMSGSFASTNGTTHISQVSVQNGQSYTFYARCKDTAGNTTMDDYVISFSVAQPSISIPVDTASTLGAPVIFYTDIVSGPNTGGENNNGAFLSIFGKNFGSDVSHIKAYVGNGEVARIAYLGASLGRPDVQQLSVQLGPNTTTGSIKVVVNGVSSNTDQAFTVRQGNIYFVATSGNDANSGTFATPWRTIAYGKSKLFPGDILYIMNGVDQVQNDPWGSNDSALRISTSYNSARAGTAENPIALVAYPGAKTVIGCHITNCGTAIRVYLSHWVFAGLTVTGGSNSFSGTIGLNDYLSPLTNIRAVNNDMTSGYYGMHAYSSSNAYFLGNHIHDMPHSAFYYGGGKNASNIEVGWNYMNNIGTPGQGIYGIKFYYAYTVGSIPQAERLTTDIRVHDNLVHDTAGAGILIGGADWGGYPWLQDVSVYNNVVYRAGRPNEGSIRIGNVGLGETEMNLKIYNNTLYANSRSLELAEVKTAHIANNIFMQTNGENYTTGSSAVGAFTMHNNLYFGGTAIPSVETSAVNGDPRFVAPSSGNLRLQSTSPAINTGSSLASTLVSRDHNGTPRPQGSTYDIGAYEYCTTCSASPATVPVQTPTSVPVSTAQSNAPVIFYTDITSGPNTGGQNNKGVFVRVFGKNFGASRGTSFVTIGGGAADNYPTWSDTEISFQLGANARTGSVVVTTQSGASNGLPFTIRLGNIYFVDLQSPNNPGSGTFADPWRSPSSFYANAQPGDTMYMRAGVYNGEYGYRNWGANFAMRVGTGSGFTRSGTEAMPIAYLAYPGEKVTLSAPGPTGLVRAFRVAANSATEAMPDWIVVGNFAMESYNACIANGGNPGIYGTGWRIVNNDCLGLTTTAQVQTGSIVPGGDHSKVLGNAVHGGRTANKLDHAIYSQACGDQVEIGWNHIYDNSFDSGPLISINYEGTRCTARGDGYAGAIYVHDNIIDATTYPSRGVYAYEQDWDDGDPILPITYVYNNVFLGAGGPGANGALVVRNGGMEAYNNSFFNNRHTCLELSGPTPNIEHLVFKNNICHMQSSATSYIGYPQDAPAARDVRDNVYYGLGNYTGMLDVRPINADPMFVNPNSGDLRLQAGSPAINTGSSLASTFVSRDHNGTPRPQGSAYDIGAYEYCTTCSASSATVPVPVTQPPTTTQPPSQTTTPSASTPTPTPSSPVTPASQQTTVSPSSSSGGSSPAPLPTQTQVSSSAIKEGSLIRGPDGIKVYIVNAHGYKRHIFNPAIFTMYGHFRWNEIKEVSQQTLDSYITSDLYRADGDTKVFSLHEINEAQGLAQKRWFNTTATKFQQLGYTFNQVFIINPRERDYYQEGTPIAG